MAVARYFNDTYDTIENRTRAYKKSALQLVKEAEEAGRMEMNMKKSVGGGSNKKATPKKDAADEKKGVKSGRVSKKTPKTPSKMKKVVDDDEDKDEDMEV